MTARHTLLEQLSALRLNAMARAFEEQLSSSEIEQLSFEERLGLLLDRENTDRAQRRYSQRLRKAKLRFPQAAIEALELDSSRGLDRSQVLDLASCRFIDQHRNVLITGKTGVGKTFLACALGQQACREGYSVLYRRLPQLFRELTIARGDGSYGLLLQRITRTQLLILDDWALHALGEAERRDLYEIFEDRHGLCSTVVISQLAKGDWYDAIGDPTLADSIVDRLFSSAYTFALKGESRRRGPATAADDTTARKRGSQRPQDRRS